MGQHWGPGIMWVAEGDSGMAGAHSPLLSRVLGPWALLLVPQYPHGSKGDLVSVSLGHPPEDPFCFLLPQMASLESDLGIRNTCVAMEAGQWVPQGPGLITDSEGHPMYSQPPQLPFIGQHV